MVLTATPVPLVTLPLILIRDVVPAGHLPLLVCVANLTFAFVVPLLAAHLRVMFSVPDGAPVLVKAPVPLPPVAATGVQFDNVALILEPTVFVTNFVHLPGGGTAADAGAASGTANNDADAATTANARVRAERFTVLLVSLAWAGISGRVRPERGAVARCDGARAPTCRPTLLGRCGWRARIPGIRRAPDSPGRCAAPFRSPRHRSGRTSQDSSRGSGPASSRWRRRRSGSRSDPFPVGLWPLAFPLLHGEPEALLVLSSVREPSVSCLSTTCEFAESHLCVAQLSRPVTFDRSPKEDGECSSCTGRARRGSR